MLHLFGIDAINTHVFLFVTKTCNWSGFDFGRIILPRWTFSRDFYLCCVSLYVVKQKIKQKKL